MSLVMYDWGRHLDRNSEVDLGTVAVGRRGIDVEVVIRLTVANLGQLGSDWRRLSSLSLWMVWRVLVLDDAIVRG